MNVSSHSGTSSSRSFTRMFESIVDNIGIVLQGKKGPIELAVVCLLADGHLLIEDVPGVGKTSLAKLSQPPLNVLGSAFSSLPICYLPILSVFRFGANNARPLSFKKDRYSPTLCSLTKSTVHLPRLSPPYWKRWKNAKFRLTA